jgi:hypothetical protein
VASNSDFTIKTATGATQAPVYWGDNGDMFIFKTPLHSNNLLVDVARNQCRTGLVRDQ